MKQQQSITIPFTGGIISPGYLRELMELAEAALVTHVQFGLRQQLLMQVPLKHFKQFAAGCKSRNIEFRLTKEAAPNITSSYPGAGIFLTDGWLREGVYKDVFALFDFTPKLKVNICDNHQTFAPLFTGHINWIASDSPHYWQLHIRFPRTSHLYGWPEMVYTNDLALLTRTLEEQLGGQPPLTAEAAHAMGEQLYRQVKAKQPYTGKPLQQPLALPSFHLPYYEGFNRQDNNYWLGIYRRDELFPVAFLKDICSICLETKTGQLYATPWKSVIVKNIQPQHRHLWDYVLGKYRINVRHAANELNWQVEDGQEDALVLKRHIIRYFDKEDVRTYGLCFSIQLKSLTGVFGSVIVQKQQGRPANRLKSLERYTIWYTRDFNPNSGELILFRDQVAKEHLGPYLVSLCKYFYERESRADILENYNTLQQKETENNTTGKILYQCGRCATVYDEATGEPDQDVAPGTAFGQLPPHFCCPLCDNPLTGFKPVQQEVLFG